MLQALSGVIRRAAPPHFIRLIAVDVEKQKLLHESGERKQYSGSREFRNDDVDGRMDDFMWGLRGLGCQQQAQPVSEE